MGHSGTWTTGQVKLRVTICLRKETDTKKLSTGGWQGQQQRKGQAGPWVQSQTLLTWEPQGKLPEKCLQAQGRVPSHRSRADLHQQGCWTTPSLLICSLPALSTMKMLIFHFVYVFGVKSSISAKLRELSVNKGGGSQQN